MRSCKWESKFKVTQESLSSKEVAMEDVQVVRLLNRYERKGKEEEEEECRRRDEKVENIMLLMCWGPS
ncbi:hypothetical protein QJS10_CPB11g01027 [Acorus calamus]|uniref:Uncharacterized protein n=1 Tax=Acorus calamus TaxID=4465 RepID=A0AAV9DSH5_ACOCL|nr:hypothetical protein QJS10_CPB11g01027 [Acorus calamus]